MKIRSIVSATFMVGFMASPSQAQSNAVALTEYLNSMDRTEVTFSGRILYDTSDQNFLFYNEDREPFGVTMDAGRDTRERVEAECSGITFTSSYDELCSISGSGTVEIRGSRVFISIEVVDQLAD